MDWLLLMQHYGVPTRLLDWTESILVATYFAVCERTYRDSDGAIWALDPYALGKHHTGKAEVLASDNEPARSIVLEACGKISSRTEKVIGIRTQEFDARMLAQLSHFTLHGTRTPLNRINGCESYWLKFEIEAKAKAGLMNCLSDLGVRESTLFPDLEHLANELRSRFWPG